MPEVWNWIAIVWVSSAVVVVAAERFMSRFGTAVWDSKDKASSALAYGLIVLFAPVVILIVMGMASKAFFESPRRFIAMISGRPFDPLSETKSKWIDQEKLSFTADLVRRRQVHDGRLREENLDDWMMWQFKETPDAAILGVCTVYVALHDANVSDELIWERLEARRYEKGEGQLPSSCELDGYIEYRLEIEDPDYLKLGSKFLKDHIELCMTYARHHAQKSATVAWPPLNWLRRKLTLSEFERFGDSIDPVAEGAPAALYLSGSEIQNKFDDLKLLMLLDDELWTFSSPQEHWANLVGRGGIVLVRNGRPIAHIITEKN